MVAGVVGAADDAPSAIYTEFATTMFRIPPSSSCAKREGRRSVSHFFVDQRKLARRGQLARSALGRAPRPHWVGRRLLDISTAEVRLPDAWLFSSTGTG